MYNAEKIDVSFAAGIVLNDFHKILVWFLQHRNTLSSPMLIQTFGIMYIYIYIYIYMLLTWSHNYSHILRNISVYQKNWNMHYFVEDIK